VNDRPDPDRFITSAEAATARLEPPPQLPPVVVTLPEDLTPDQLSVIPNPPTERTATVLLDLQEMVVNQFDVEDAQVVQVVGAVRENGTIGLYRLLERPGSTVVRSWAAAWYLNGVFGAEAFIDDEAEELAKQVYDQKAEGDA
jgi:hypothetical protein